MLDTDRIRLMSQLAIFEKKESRDIIEASRYFKSDYISRRIISAIFHYTLCFLLIVVILLFIQLDTILAHLSLTLLVDSGRYLAIWYILGAVCTVLLTWAMYTAKYETVHRKSLFYMSKLEKLLDMMEGKTSQEPARSAAPSLSGPEILRQEAPDLAREIRQYRQERADAALRRNPGSQAVNRAEASLRKDSGRQAVDRTDAAFRGNPGEQPMKGAASEIDLPLNSGRRIQDRIQREAARRVIQGKPAGETDAGKSQRKGWLDEPAEKQSLSRGNASEEGWLDEDYMHEENRG